jgi:23S rRNA (uracil1939-C5)-methyltransferase
MQLKKETEIEVEIKYLNISGRGIAETTIEDQPYFVAVAGLYPGDKALVSITKIKKKYLEAKLVKLIKASDKRVEARSDHANVCGGSPWEVLDYNYQLEIKQTEVSRILENIKVDPEVLNPIIPTDEPWYYRNKMQYSFGFDSEMKQVLGLHISGRKFDIFDVKDCHLAEPWFNDVLEFFRENLYATGLVPYSFNTGEGDLRTLTLRSAKNTQKSMLILTVSPSAHSSKTMPFLNKAMEKFPEIDTWYLEVMTAKKGSPTTATLQRIHGEPDIIETITVNDNEYSFSIGPNTFFQPNTETASKIYEKVIELADIKSTDIVYDLFSGAGTIGISVANKAKHVYGVDIVKESIKKANKNLKLNEIENATYLCADVFKLPEDLDWPTPDVVIVDPPRAGLTPRLIDYIVKLNAKKIVYVSCNLKSFCQDVLEFANHDKKLVSVTPIDQFPHTKHLEVVSLIV